MNYIKIEFDNNILIGAWCKLLNHVHPQNNIHSPPEQNQNISEKQEGRKEDYYLCC